MWHCPSVPGLEATPAPATDTLAGAGAAGGAGTGASRPNSQDTHTVVGFGGRDRISGTPHPESHTESSMVHPDNSFSPRRLDTALDRASAA